MLDIKATQGSYWKGAQLPYWIYMVVTMLPFTGALGLDHLLLRSPITALLKFLSLPLFGYWYFYDIAQAAGERDLLEKYGIAVPFYGPTGIGAGIFSGTEGIPLAPNEIPGPWKYFAYALATCFFIAFPINKFIIGDYAGGIAQLCMYLILPLAICWGLYDIYRVLLDTKGIFENGTSRFLPASWLLGANFRREALGPYGPAPPEQLTGLRLWFHRLFNAVVEIPIASAKVVSGTIDVTRDATIGTADSVVKGVKAGVDTTTSVVQGVGAVAKGVGQGVGAAVDGVGEGTKAVTSGVANVVVGEVKEAAAAASDVVQTTKAAADTAVQATAGTVAEGAKAAEGVASLVAKIPAIGEKVASELADPSKLVEEAKKGAVVAQLGGFMLANQGQESSVSTAVVLFTVGLLAFSGYVFYTLRNFKNKATEKSDDPPPNPRAVRGTFKAKGY